MHGVPEGDNIPSLKSNRQTLELECCFPGVLCDNGDAPDNLMAAMLHITIITIIIIIVISLLLTD